MHPCDQASWRLNWESQRSRSDLLLEREGKVSGWKTSLLESLQQRAQRGRWHNWQQRVPTRKFNELS